MEFGIAQLDTMRIRRFKFATDLETFGRIRLKSIVKEEGFKFNPEGIKSYMDTWLEWEAEVSDDEDAVLSTCSSQLVDVAADNMTYCNVHLQKLPSGSNTWIPLTSKDKEIFYQAIVDKLEEALLVETV